MLTAEQKEHMNKDAQRLGRLGGIASKKGLSAKQRSEIAKKAAMVRWGKKC